MTKQTKVIKLMEDAIEDVKNDHILSAKDNLQIAMVYLESIINEKFNQK